MTIIKHQHSGTRFKISSETMIGEPIMMKEKIETNCKLRRESIIRRPTSHHQSSNMSLRSPRQRSSDCKSENSHLNDLKTTENLSPPATKHQNLTRTLEHSTRLAIWCLIVATCCLSTLTEAQPGQSATSTRSLRRVSRRNAPQALDYQSTSLMTGESRYHERHYAPDYQAAAPDTAVDQAATSLAADRDTSFADHDGDQPASPSSSSSSLLSSNFNGDDVDDESVAENQPDDQGVLMDHHTSQLKAMHDLFERRQMSHQHHPLQQQHHNHHDTRHQPLQSSQELSPISIGLDPASPFSMPPFPVAPNGHEPVPPPPPPSMAAHPKPQMSNADNIDQGLGPSLPFGLSPLPHLMGFPGSAFEGPQRGDQSAHTNYHTPAPIADPEGGGSGGVASGPNQKVWPKIFRFTDGRINLSDFEKQKKIRLSNKNQHNGDNYIESAPIMFDGRPLKRKSFLILHGGIFSRRK